MAKKLCVFLMMLATVGCGQSQTKRVSMKMKEDDTEVIHVQLEAMAKVAEAKALARKDAIFAEAKVSHDKDVSGFAFKCSRWGEWLEISTARLGNERDKRFSTALNLNLVTNVTLVRGHVPDLEGEVEYYVFTQGDDGTGSISGSGIDGNEPAPRGFHYVVLNREPYIPTDRPLFYITPKPDNNYAWQMGNQMYQIRLKTPHYPRPAEDDQIKLTGIDATLYTPAGQGERVYREILNAKGLQ